MVGGKYYMFAQWACVNSVSAPSSRMVVAGVFARRVCTDDISRCYWYHTLCAVRRLGWVLRERALGASVTPSSRMVVVASVRAE